MDLREHLLRLVAPTRVGEALAPGIVLVDASTELGLRLTLEHAGTRAHVEVRPPEPDRPFARRTQRWALSYRAEPGLDPAAAMRITEAVAERVAANEGAAGLPDPEATTERVRRVRVDRILEPGPGFDTLSPYVGCLVGGRFCYAQSRLVPLRRVLGMPDVPWGSWVDVRTNAAERLAEALASRPPRPIKLCPIVSDPYQAIERRERITRACLETIAERAPQTPVLVLTRSDAILDDLAVLRRLPYAWAGMSVPSADPEVLAHFEPRAPSPARRREVLVALREAGVHTFAVAQPMLPGDLDAHVQLLRGAVASVSLDVLHGVEAAADDFADPRWAAAARDDWQRTRAEALRDALRDAGIEVWAGELLPALAAADY